VGRVITKGMQDSSDDGNTFSRSNLLKGSAFCWGLWERSEKKKGRKKNVDGKFNFQPLRGELPHFPLKTDRDKRGEA